MKTMLFFDDWLVERRDCLERVWGRPAFVKEIFTDCYPGFLGYEGFITAFYDEGRGRYVMYLAVSPPKADPETFVVRLESDDPRQWPNPVYDVSATPAWKGFKDVVVDQDGERFWPFAVRTLAGTPHADRGYFTTEWDFPGEKSYLGFSADGLHFTVDRARPWADPGSDAPGHLLWIDPPGMYVLFTRRVNTDRRIVASTTTDFEHFSPLLTALQPDARDPVGTEFYDMPARRYEDVYLGLLHVQSTDPFEKRRVKMAGRIETQLAHSYNGVHWCRPVREPFIDIRDYGLNGGGTMYAMEIMRTKDDKLLFFATASKGDHDAYLDMQAAGTDTTEFFTPLLYEMRLDGFCSLKTRARDGLLETKTLMLQGDRMSLNVRTTAHTAVRVEMLDGETMEPIPEYTLEEAIPITGDHLFAEPRWKERCDLSGLVGKPVRVRVHMREAELFAIRLDCQAHFSNAAPIDSLF
jgi:hypothetical protein